MISLNVNGKTVSLDVEPDTPLLWVLRDFAGLTGTKYGCGMALCGACTVHIDGQPARSCTTPVSARRRAEDHDDRRRSARPRPARRCRTPGSPLDVPQCGYCQSGQIMSAAALLATKKSPSDADIDAAMAGNLCRCATYVRIRAAIKRAARALA